MTASVTKVIGELTAKRRLTIKEVINELHCKL